VDGTAIRGTVVPNHVVNVRTGERRGQRLDRDVAPEARVTGTEHLAHAPRAEGVDDLVRTVPCAGRQHHRGNVL
jgi:hypothetical protein